MPEISPAFLALPARQLADAALSRARELGAEHADFRLERIRVGGLDLRDGQLDSSTDSEDVGAGGPRGPRRRVGFRRRYRPLS